MPTFRSVCWLYRVLSLTLFTLHPLANASQTLIVDPSGKGDHLTLGEAIASLPMFCYERTVIYLKNGTYEEKVRIDQDFITLRGESRDGVRIIGDLPRQLWIDAPDAIGPAVVNLFGDDIIIENLTIENTQPDTSVHAFAVYGQGTRTLIQNANVWSRGGDTVSLWNYKNGMYYHANCDFRGAVDFVCPRGWCYITSSTFHCVRTTAAVWHAGGYDASQKLVIHNSSFDGDVPFELGRHHYDAQFYFIGCDFSENVMDRPVYRVRYEDPSRNRPENWGDRVYFHASRSEHLPWTSDNLSERTPSLEADEISASWTFDGKWNPENTIPPQVISVQQHGSEQIDLTFDETITVRGHPELHKDGRTLRYVQGAGSNQLSFIGELPDHPEQENYADWDVRHGELIGNTATRKERRFATP